MGIWTGLLKTLQVLSSPYSFHLQGDAVIHLSPFLDVFSGTEELDHSLLINRVGV